jgi:hypothetical protein
MRRRHYCLTDLVVLSVRCWFEVVLVEVRSRHSTTICATYSQTHSHSPWLLEYCSLLGAASCRRIVSFCEPLASLIASSSLLAMSPPCMPRTASEPNQFSSTPPLQQHTDARQPQWHAGPQIEVARMLLQRCLFACPFVYA